MLIEVLPRSTSRRFGEAPSATRNFKDIPDAQGTSVFPPSIGEGHPDNADMKCTDITEDFAEEEGQRVKVISATYAPETGGGGTCDQHPDPLLRCDRWAVTVSSATVPATEYYDEDGNTKPLLNTAGDPFEGLKKRAPDIKMQVSGNREAFPMGEAAAIVGYVNEDSFAGGAAGAWLCSGLSAEQSSEMVANIAVDYWSVRYEFLLRKGGWELKIPNVGLHWLQSYTNRQGLQEVRKYKCTVYTPGQGWTAASQPIPLAPDGTMYRYTAGWKESDGPDMLSRKIYEEANFGQYFSDPPSA